VILMVIRGRSAPPEAGPTSVLDAICDYLDPRPARHDRVFMRGRT